MRQKTISGYKIPDFSVYNLMLPQQIIGGDNTMENKEDFETAKESEQQRLKEKGDVVSGVLSSMTPSEAYENKWVVKYLDNDEPKICFINSIGHGLFVDNRIEAGDEFILEHDGKKKSDKGREYHTYKLMFRRAKKE